MTKARDLFRAFFLCCTPRGADGTRFRLHKAGIAHDVAVRANAGKLDADQLDTDWIISPDTNLPVPWIWIRALSAAWERYKTEGGPLGRAFGLEGGGQGKSPTID
jgi:hypothetical protein